MDDSQGADGTEVHREGLVRGGLAVWVRGLGRGIPFAWVLMSKSDSVVPSPAAGGGSGWRLGSWGDSQGVVGTEVRKVAISVVLESALSVKSLNLLTLVSGGGSGSGLGRCVSGSPGADLVQEEAVHKV